MNAVEIEEAVSDLASAPFEASAFPYAFLTAFGVKETTIARLRKGDTNASDVGGVLQRGNIHIAVATPGSVIDTLRALRESPRTASAKAKFILATDGQTLEAEDLVSGEPLACPYSEFADHFGFFLPLAGISTVKELKNNPIDVKATGRLNRLYVELLKENPDWGTVERRHDLNQFMARLIFCFFAEDTGIFNGNNLFTSTVEQMSTTEAGSVEHVLSELFRAMDIRPEARATAKLRSWADAFPWVNGGLFAGGKPCPKFSRVARSYLLRAGELNWKEINPDIFGSMIQAVADDGERGSLGMHYTSVPNIMKVLGPLFLDDLRVQLEAACDNVRKLRNLRKRLSHIRVFDPACGSGNFLVIAYIRMREIEHEIVKLTDDEPKSVIPLANFYGIEIKDFAAEIARLALLIAEFQCDVRFINQRVARSLVLPLKNTGQIKTGNALIENWLDICPPVKNSYEQHDLAAPTGRLDLNNSDENFSLTVETYICGNPPYLGYNKQSTEQKKELSTIFSGKTSNWRSLDYVSGWFGKAALCPYQTAFVSTNSICQGEHASILWPIIFGSGKRIVFAEPNFRWSNNAANNAGVTVSIVGIGGKTSGFFVINDGLKAACANINQYLVPSIAISILPASTPISDLPKMSLGNMPKDGGNLLLTESEAIEAIAKHPEIKKYVFDFVGSQEFIKGIVRRCIWIEDNQVDEANQSSFLRDRFDQVSKMRLESPAESTQAFANRPHRFKQIQGRGINSTVVVPKVTSETRLYLPVGLLSSDSIVSDNAFALYDAPLWNMAIIASRMHLIWVATVCGKLETRYRYSNTYGWNAFPLPSLSEKNKNDLEECAKQILIAREECFPLTIADLYEPDKMPDHLRLAHEKNDEVLERIYIGRRLRNDTERLEKLFELYIKMTTAEKKPTAGKKAVGRSRLAVGAA